MDIELDFSDEVADSHPEKLKSGVDEKDYTDICSPVADDIILLVLTMPTLSLSREPCSRSRGNDYYYDQQTKEEWLHGQGSHIHPAIEQTEMHRAELENVGSTIENDVAILGLYSLLQT